MSSSEPKDNSHFPKILSALVIFAAIVVRFLWLGSDPPLFFANTGQALLTDPYNVIYHARNKIIFGEWDIFDFGRWSVFKYSLSSFFCYLVFLLGGVSRITANLSAVLLNLGGLLFYLAAFRRKSQAALTAVSLLLLTNMTLIVYGRYPFLENGLIFLSGLLYFLFLRYYKHDWMLVLAGLLTAFCVLSGKLFGIVLFVPLALVIITDTPSLKWKRLSILSGSFILSAAGILIAFYGRDIGSAYNYVVEQTIGMYGVPDAAFSPLELLRKAVSFGGDSRLFYFAPFFMTLLVLGFIGLILRKDSVTALKNNKALLFNLGWFLAGYLLLMVVNYRPLRYQLFLLLPAAGIISHLTSEIMSNLITDRLRPVRSILLLFILWYFTTQAGYIVSYLYDYGSASTKIAWYSAAPAAVLWLSIVKFRVLVFGLINNRKYLLTVLVAASIALQAGWIIKWSGTRTYLLREAGEDLNQIAAPNAVICGPFAQALTIDNKLRSFIYMFGLSRKEPDLFNRFPITHLAADISNIKLASRDYPGAMTGSYKLADYWLRDIKIDVIQLPEKLIKGDYQPTDFEKAARFYSAAKHPDSVFYYLREFLTEHPRNMAGLRLLSNYYQSAGAVEQGFRVFEQLISYYPDDFSLYFENARAYYLFYLNSRNQEYLKQSEKYFRLAREKNKYIEADIEAARESLRSMVK